jgi:hypothetical protein
MIANIAAGELVGREQRAEAGERSGNARRVLDPQITQMKNIDCHNEVAL